jgi:hypothetical protein
MWISFAVLAPDPLYRTEGARRAYDTHGAVRRLSRYGRRCTRQARDRRRRTPGGLQALIAASSERERLTVEGLTDRVLVARVMAALVVVTPEGAERRAPDVVGAILSRITRSQSSPAIAPFPRASSMGLMLIAVPPVDETDTVPYR